MATASNTTNLMHAVAVIGEKGGTGKTTILLGVAVAAACMGHSVVVIDLDPQTSAANWNDRRKDQNLAVVSVQANRLGQALDQAREAGATYVFIDSPGRNDDIALKAARAANLVLLPTRPHMIELETLPHIRDLLRLAGSPPAYVVLNGIHPAAGRASVNAIQESIRDIFDFASCPDWVCQRNLYFEAVDTGKTPQDVDPDGKASGELNRVFKFVNETAGSQPHQATGNHDAALSALGKLLKETKPRAEPLSAPVIEKRVS
jgi:chromosome partitioning protein